PEASRPGRTSRGGRGNGASRKFTPDNIVGTFGPREKRGRPKYLGRTSCCSRPGRGGPLCYRSFYPRVDFLAEAATRTGFGDQSHFTRGFRRFFGVTPGHYRTA